MRVYIKFISIIFFKSLLFVFFVVSSLVLFLNILSELEFFKNENVELSFTLFLSVLNSPTQIFIRLNYYLL